MTYSGNHAADIQDDEREREADIAASLLTVRRDQITEYMEQDPDWFIDQFQRHLDKSSKEIMECFDQDDAIRLMAILRSGVILARAEDVREAADDYAQFCLRNRLNYIGVGG